MEKVTGYLTRRRAGRWQLLVFHDPGWPDFGWVVPGGTVEAGEGLEAAMRREILEESGRSDVMTLRYLGAVRHASAAGDAVHRHFFTGTVGADCPDRFTHVTRSADEDNGWVCLYEWLDIGSDAPVLGGHLGLGLPALRAALKSGTIAIHSV